MLYKAFFLFPTVYWFFNKICTAGLHYIIDYITDHIFSLPPTGCSVFGLAVLPDVGLPSALAAVRPPPLSHGVASADAGQPPGQVETGFLSLRTGVAVCPVPLPRPGLYS